MSQEPLSSDDHARHAWWNSMNEGQRMTVLRQANARSVSEAWDWHKLRMILEEMSGSTEDL